MIPKASGGWRPCGNYRHLNAVTEADQYAIPRIYDFAARLSGAKIFLRWTLCETIIRFPSLQKILLKLLWLPR